MNSYQRYQLQRVVNAHAAFNAVIMNYPLTCDDLEGENWRDLFDGYQISNFGRVKSIYKKTVHIRKPFLLHFYLAVELRKYGKRQRPLVHRLVAEAFIPNPDNKPQVNHIDGNRLNNHVSNLEWCTQSENIQHSLRVGLKKSGEDNYLAVFSNETVKWIRAIYKPYDKIFGAIPLAKLLGVSEATIRAVVNGKHYKYI